MRNSIDPGELMRRGERLIAIADRFVGDTFCITEFVQFPYGGYGFADCPLEGDDAGERFWGQVFSTPDEALQAWNEMCRLEERLGPLDVFRGGVGA